MNKNKNFSKRTLYAILLFSMFIFTPMVFEDIVNSTMTTIEDTRTNDEEKNVIATSKLQTITFDAPIPFIYENITNVTFDGIISQNEYSETYVDAVGFAIHWEHNGINLSIAIEANGLGFIAIGLASDTMDGANMIIGGEFANNTDYCLDAIGQPSYSNPVALDSQSDILSCMASENATSTILEFKIPLNSSDIDDPAMETSNTYNFFITYHETLDDVFDPSISNHVGMVHSNPNKKLFLRPSLETFQTQISISTPSEVEQGKNFSLSAILVDEDQNPITDLPVDFFRETRYGELIIGSAITDNNGLAELNYSNDILRGNITFGVTFNEFIGKINSFDVNYLKSQIITEVFFSHIEFDEQEVRDVLFIPIEDACCDGGIFYLLVLRDVLFYLALFSVWGLYFYCVILALKIPFNKMKSKNSQKDDQPMEDN